MCTIALSASLAPARAQFTGITDFGDSYADTGAGPGGAFRLLGPPYYNPCPPQYPYCRFTGGPTTFVDSLQSIYGLPAAVNYAIGGARTDSTNTFGAPYGFRYELAQFAAAGTRLTDRDLVALSIGGNDFSGIDLTGLTTEPEKMARIDAGATTAATTAVAGVQQLVAAGARTIAWLSPGNSKYFPVPPNGPVAFGDAERDVFAHVYFQQVQQLLVPIADSGVRIFLFDYETLQARIAADPGRYGFAADPTCQAYSSGNPSCFYDNTVHPTSAGMALIARYMANQIDAPTTVVPQRAIVLSLATGFANAELDRLDVDRTVPRSVSGSATAAADKRWSISVNANHGSGNHDGKFPAASYDYSGVGGTLAIDYRLDKNWRLGGGFDYAQPTVNLGAQNAHNRINAYQFAGYVSFGDVASFVDVLIAYGRYDFSLDRQGVIDTIKASTSANAFTAAARGGYLFDAGKVRAGPIAGLTFSHGDIHGYTEAGDSLLTMMVNGQTFDTVIASAGVQVRYPFVLHEALCDPFIDVTAEHQFSGSGRSIATTQVTTPLLPVLTAVPDTSGTYGKIAAGIAASIAGNLSANVTGLATFGRDGGNDFVVSIGMKSTF